MTEIVKAEAEERTHGSVLEMECPSCGEKYCGHALRTMEIVECEKCGVNIEVHPVMA